MAKRKAKKSFLKVIFGSNKKRAEDIFVLKDSTNKILKVEASDETFHCQMLTDSEVIIREVTKYNAGVTFRGREKGRDIKIKVNELVSVRELLEERGY